MLWTGSMAKLVGGHDDGDDPQHHKGGTDERNPMPD